MTRYRVSAELTVSDGGLYVEADSIEDAQALAREQFGDPHAWQFHIGDGSVDLFVTPVDKPSDSCITEGA